jgi:hypothetical protein
MMTPIEAITALFNLFLFNEFSITIGDIDISLFDLYRINYGTTLSLSNNNIGFIASTIFIALVITIAIYYLFDICILIYKRCTK